MNAPDSNKKICPKCKKIMKSIRAGNAKFQMELDVCTPCVLIWFDRNELEQLVSVNQPGSHREKPIPSGNASSTKDLYNDDTTKSDAILELMESVFDTLD